jgi:DNA transposition AAA+ family ATPase
MITPQQKKQTVEALEKARQNFSGSDAKFATSIGISAAQYSRIKNGDVEQVLSSSNWISLARQFSVNLTGKANWKTANTKVFKAISAHLAQCQKHAVSSMLCDNADIGKTYTAKYYKAHHKEVAYIDCSQYKSKQKLVRAIAKEFGVNHTGKYNDVYADLVWVLQEKASPLIILDEAGDLDYSAFLEIKALWNAVEDYCGWYMMGADGLKEKVRRAIDNKKVGYTELFSRFGSKYIRITAQGSEDYKEERYMEAAAIIKANTSLSEKEVAAIVNKTNGSLRRIAIELSKLNRN